MEIQPVGTQYSDKGSGLAVDNGSSSTQLFQATLDSSPERVRAGAAPKEGNSKSEITKVPSTSVLCPKEKYRQNAGHFRFDRSKYLYPVRKIPNADCFAGADPASPWGRYMYYRSHRRLLAYSDCKEPYPLPWLQTGKESLLLQSNAVRIKYSPKNLHKTRKSSSPASPIPGDNDCGLSGRLADMGSVQKRMCPGSTKGDRFHSIPGVLHQYKEIKTSPIDKLPMARPTMGLNKTHSLPSTSQAYRNCQNSQDIYSQSVLIPKNTRKSPGPITVCINSSPDPKSSSQRYQSGMALQSQQTSQGPQIVHATHSSKTTTAMGKSCQVNQKGSPSTTPSVHDDSYGRISRWLGGTLGVSESTREVVGKVSNISYQCTGGHGGSSSLETDSATQKDPYPLGPRQYSSDAQYQQRGFEIPIIKSCDDRHFLSSSQKRLAYISNSYRGGQKCDSGFSLTDTSTRIRMETGSKILPMGPSEGTLPRDRPVCDITESSTTTVCSPQSRPSGGSNGRSLSRLESMELNLSISPNQPSPEGPSQAPLIQGSNSVNSPPMVQEQLVPSPDGVGTQTLPIPEPYSDPEGANQDCVRFLLDHEKVSFMDFLRFAALRRYGIEQANINFSEAYKRDGTNRQYESHFKKLVSFIRSTKPECMTLNTSLNFFRSLFESGLSSNTINNVKSALVKIFAYAFDINVNSIHFNTLSRSCAALKPAESPMSISWSINKVLRLASSLADKEAPYKDLLRRTLFLVALASGARISELEALSRDKGHIVFLPSGEVLLTPHKKFLAKNEDPQKRWKPWKIIPLPQNPSLCPVKALRFYLDKTKVWASGRLFQREAGGTLTTTGVRQQILYFIKDADPTSIPKGHDVRKVATSLNYFQNMNFQLLTDCTHWKSVRVFIKHYFKTIDALRFSVVAAGSVVPPEQQEASDSA